MISREEVYRAIGGAFRLAGRDRSGMTAFNVTTAGFVHSFAAIVLLAPFYLVLVLIEHAPSGAPLEHVLLVEGLSYLCGWLAFPLLLIPLCRLLDLGQQYVPYVVAYNWSQVVLMSLWLPLAALLASGILGHAPGIVAGVAGFAAAYYYLWFVTRTALKTSGSIAFGIAVVEYLSGLLIHTLISRLF